MQYTVAVDLDGTIVNYDHWRGVYHIGDPYPDAIRFLQQLLRLGVRVILHTCRLTPDVNGWVDASRRIPLADARTNLEYWLAQHGLSDVALWDAPGKPFADVYLDDRAIRIDPSKVDTWTRLWSKMGLEEPSDDDHGPTAGPLGTVPLPE